MDQQNQQAQTIKTPQKQGFQRRKPSINITNNVINSSSKQNISIDEVENKYEDQKSNLETQKESQVNSSINKSEKKLVNYNILRFIDYKSKNEPNFYCVSGDIPLPLLNAPLISSQNEFQINSIHKWKQIIQILIKPQLGLLECLILGGEQKQIVTQQEIEKLSLKCPNYIIQEIYTLNQLLEKQKQKRLSSVQVQELYKNNQLLELSVQEFSKKFQEKANQILELAKAYPFYIYTHQKLNLINQTLDTYILGINEGLSKLLGLDFQQMKEYIIREGIPYIFPDNSFTKILLQLNLHKFFDKQIVNIKTFDNLKLKALCQPFQFKEKMDGQGSYFEILSIFTFDFDQYIENQSVLATRQLNLSKKSQNLNKSQIPFNTPIQQMTQQAQTYSNQNFDIQGQKNQYYLNQVQNFMEKFYANQSINKQSQQMQNNQQYQTSNQSSSKKQNEKQSTSKTHKTSMSSNSYN